MKIIKYIILGILLLISMLLCSTLVMKILDIIFKLGYENIWNIGFKVGFLAFIVILISLVFIQKKKS